MATQERDILISGIHRTFEYVTRGQGRTLHEARIIDDYGSEREQCEARKKDTDNRWWEIPDQTIASMHDAITFLDAEGFCYYLPAYLTWTLKYGPNTGWPVGDWAIGQLRGRRVEEFAVFTDEQSGVIARFLRFVVDHADEFWASEVEAAEALHRYWQRFL